MSTKKTIIIVVIAVAVAGVAMLTLLAAVVFFMAVSPVKEERVAVIYLEGPIEEGGSGFFYTGITPGYVHSQLRRAAADRSIKGVVLRVNSPGGSVAASQSIASMIKQFEKPVVVSMGDMAASGGYYISAPASGIVAHPGSMTGSIGVIMQIMNYAGLYEMIGVEVETIKSGRHKDMFGRALTGEEREILQELLDEAYGQFLAEVAEGRGMDPEQVRELATGQLFLGSQALELGLVDRLGGIDEAVDYLAELAGLTDPVRYDFSEASLLTHFFGFAQRVFQLFDHKLLSPEMILLEKMKQDFPPGMRYQ